MAAERSTAPQDLIIEREVIGACLHDRDRFAEACAVGLNGADFYDQGHKLIWRGLESLLDIGTHPDISQIYYAINGTNNEKPKIRRVELYDLIEQRTWKPIRWHCRKLKELRQLRDLGILSADTLKSVSDGTMTAEEMASAIQEKTIELMADQSATEWRSVGGVIGDILFELRQPLQADQSIPTGFSDLDRYLKGFYPGRSYILAGYTSHGKTQLAVQISLELSKGLIPVLFLSLEMSDREIIQRMGAVELNTTEDLSDKDWERMQLRMAATPLRVMAPGSLSLVELWAQCRRFKARYGYGLIIIDYLGQITKPKAENNQIAVSIISSNLKAIARTLSLPLLTLSQFRRPPDGAQPKKPTLFMLRESGSIEQDADVVLMVWHDQKEKREYVLIEKNRHGKRGQVEMKFIEEKGRWEQLSRQEDERYATPF